MQSAQQLLAVPRGLDVHSFTADEFVKHSHRKLTAPPFNLAFRQQLGSTLKEKAGKALLGSKDGFTRLLINFANVVLMKAGRGEVLRRDGRDTQRNVLVCPFEAEIKGTSCVILGVVVDSLLRMHWVCIRDGSAVMMDQVSLSQVSHVMPVVESPNDSQYDAAAQLLVTHFGSKPTTIGDSPSASTTSLNAETSALPRRERRPPKSDTDLTSEWVGGSARARHAAATPAKRATPKKAKTTTAIADVTPLASAAPISAQHSAPSSSAPALTPVLKAPSFSNAVSSATTVTTAGWTTHRVCASCSSVVTITSLEAKGFAKCPICGGLVAFALRE